MTNPTDILTKHRGYVIRTKSREPKAIIRFSKSHNVNITIKIILK